MIKHNLLKNLVTIKKDNLLILNLTNLVTINDLANIEISLGASPVMSNDLDDALSLANFAKAILINIGTINQDQGEIMLAVAKANFQKKPIMIDLVGYGATTTRNQWVEKLLPFCSAIKGNYSEVSSLYKKHNLAKGVDGDITLEDPRAIVETIAQKYQKLILMTGEVDYISNGVETYALSNGHYLLKSLTGTGCMLGAISATFLAVNNTLGALLNATSLLNLSAEKAAQKASRPQQFKSELLDKIFDAQNWIKESEIKIK